MYLKNQVFKIINLIIRRAFFPFDSLFEEIFVRNQIIDLALCVCPFFLSGRWECDIPLIMSLCVAFLILIFFANVFLITKV